MSYKVKLTKIKSNHTALRTDVIEGETSTLPTVGESFCLTGEPLDPKADMRLVVTTEIKFVEQMGNEYRFNTLNSTYKLEVLEGTPA